VLRRRVLRLKTILVANISWRTAIVLLGVAVATVVVIRTVLETIAIATTAAIAGVLIGFLISG